MTVEFSNTQASVWNTIQHLATTWATVGLRIDPEADQIKRAERLLQAAANALPGEGDRYQAWLKYASIWAELKALIFHGLATASPDLLVAFNRLRERMDHVFETWLQHHYPALYNQPPLPPVMVHHVARSLARELEECPAKKVAMIVIDGLALDQWVVLRDELLQSREDMVFGEKAIFAWIPTLTAVSRQAIFSGQIPLMFSGSIHTTEKEQGLWQQFWVERGLQPAHAGYLKGLGDGKLEELKDMLALPRRKVVGLVVDKVDRIMHGMELGAAGMLNQVRQWARGGYLLRLFQLLLEHGYDITITSDHGNVEATGIGRPVEGAMADVGGERVRVYPDPSLRGQVQARFSHTLAWPCFGLPDNYQALVARGREAFAQEGSRLVSHGGVSVEEVIIPLIKVSRRGKDA